ncbi:methyltransferase domain-containing protein [Clostridium thermosuccinogenes]|uniref:methyltransferase domain-containing protein n=1 Tax=Clostridium thermosuccinogenes TaxID=84032 RepID=UPI003BEF1705
MGWLDKEILTMEEAAELFGVSVKTFIKLLKEEKVPARKIGREWRFSRKALIDWLSSGDSQSYSLSEVDAKDFFDEVAPKWEELSRSYYGESIKNKLIEMNIFNKDMIVMDLGCGDGYIARGISKLVKKVIAVDISGEMLKELRKKAEKSGITNVETLQTQAEDVPVEDSSVDAVCANMFLHHMEDPEVQIREMYRIVKPGGIAVVSDYVEHSDRELKEKMHDVWMGFNKNEMKKWFMAAGFKGIKTQMVQDARNIGIFIMIANK